MSKCPIGIEYSCDECGLCDSNKKSNKPTNADRIRRMSDEELVDFIVGQRYCDANENSEKVILEWLQQPKSEVETWNYIINFSIANTVV